MEAHCRCGSRDIITITFVRTLCDPLAHSKCKYETDSMFTRSYSGVHAVRRHAGLLVNKKTESRRVTASRSPLKRGRQ